MATPRVFLLMVLAGSVPAALGRDNANVAANPIRKVVSLLQKMAKTVAEEASKEKELFDKYACWCKTGSADLEASISENTAQVPALQADIEEAESQLAKLQQEIPQHQADRAAAKEAMGTATALREKEHAAFLKASGELKSFISSLAKAIPAIEAGMAGTGFLQGRMGATAKVLRSAAAAASANGSLTDDDKQSVLAFLEGDAAYVPASGEIVGILKTMSEGFAKELAAEEKAESAAVKLYEDLMAAKTKEVEVLGASIEKKLARVGELGVSIVSMKNQLGDAEAALIEDQKFLKDLSKNCEAKQAEWDDRVKTRAEELSAIHDTIKILNDDEALELFKKTLPSASFLQIKVGRQQAQRALSLLTRSDNRPRLQIRLLEFALTGKKVDFSKVIKMIDDMLAILKGETADDENKKEYCNTQLDTVEDKAKELGHKLEDLDTAIASRQETIATLTEELKVLKAGIVELDKAVQAATEQRKAEHDEFTELMASDAAAKELIEFAKNRLAKFYSPKLYKAPPKRVLSEEEKIYTSMGGELAPTPAPGGIAGTGVEAFVQLALHRDAPPPPPETYGAYQTKSDEHGGVVAMMDLLIRDLAKEMTTAETEEAASQTAYEKLMSDSAEKRAKDAKAIGTKEAAKADTEQLLVTEQGEQTSTSKELAATKLYEGQLHAECDWLLANFDLREAARAQEAENLQAAKAVLSGADFSLLQTVRPGKKNGLLLLRQQRAGQ